MIPFWKRRTQLPLPPLPAETPTLASTAPTLSIAVAAPEHRVFWTHSDAVELWGIVNDPAVDLSYQECFTVNDGVDANGVAK